MFTVTIRQLKELIQRTPPHVAVMAWGKPGVGKTSAMAQAAAAMGAGFEVLIGSLRPPEDILGLPDLDRESGMSRYLPFPWLSRITYDAARGEGPDPAIKVLVLLDEINAAPPRTQLALQRVILERAVDDRRVHPNVRFAAAGNRIEDAAFAHEMPSSLANRMLHVTVEPSLEDWVADFGRGNIRDDIISYLWSKPGQFLAFDPARDTKAFPSPRSWKLASDVMGAMAGADDALLLAALAGSVGQGAATEYLAHVRLAGQVPTADEIEADPDGARVPEDPSAAYYAVGSLVSALLRSPDKDRAEAHLRYVWRCHEQFRVLYMRQALKGGDESRQALLVAPLFHDPQRGALALVRELV